MFAADACECPVVVGPVQATARSGGRISSLRRVLRRPDLLPDHAGVAVCLLGIRRRDCFCCIVVKRYFSERKRVVVEVGVCGKIL